MAAACVHGHNYMYHSYIMYIIIMWQSQNIFRVEEVIDIQTAITKDCGSEIYTCACSSIIHKGIQKISIKLSMTN